MRGTVFQVFCKENKMKKLLLGFAAVIAASVLCALTPEEVLEKARTQTSVKTMASDAQVDIQKPIGTSIEILNLREYTGKNSGGQQATMIMFTGPAKYKNTRFLMIERKDNTTDQRVFLPSMGKSRRIAAESEGSSSFFGTDFSYNDMAFMSRSVSLDTHKFLKDENYAGLDCYVIESTPNNKKESYSKSVSKVSKSDNRLLCAEFFDKHGKAVKFIELLDYKTVDGVITPMSIKMTTYATKSSTVISIKKIKYGLTVPPAVFTTRYLETGK